MGDPPRSSRKKIRHRVRRYGSRPRGRHRGAPRAHHAVRASRGRSMIGTPMLKAAGLWKRTSQRGADYFAGRLGSVKIVILENRDRKAENDPTHWLWFTEPTPAATNSAQRTDEARPARTRKS